MLPLNTKYNYIHFCTFSLQNMLSSKKKITDLKLTFLDVVL